MKTPIFSAYNQQYRTHMLGLNTDARRQNPLINVRAVAMKENQAVRSVFGGRRRQRIH